MGGSHSGTGRTSRGGASLVVATALVVFPAMFRGGDAFFVPRQSCRQDIDRRVKSSKFGVSFFGKGNNNNNNNNNGNAEKKSSRKAAGRDELVNGETRGEVSMLELEKQVHASARAKLDVEQLKKVMDIRDDNDENEVSHDDKFFLREMGEKRSGDVDSTHRATTKTNAGGRRHQRREQSAAANKNDVTPGDLIESSGRVPASKWKIAAASGAAAFAMSFVLVPNAFVCALASAVVFFAASRDPLREGEGDVSGALARTVGRYTIQSVEATQPKVKAVARAVVTGDEEISVLRRKLRDAREENERMKLWIERRNKVDQSLSSHTLGDLKTMARENKLRVGGTKAQILMRLVEAEVIDL